MSPPRIVAVNILSADFATFGHVVDDIFSKWDGDWVHFGKNTFSCHMLVD